MPRALNKCPDCGSTVSQFAAGCAICGADLVAARLARERRRQAVPSLTAPGWFPQITGADAVLGALLIIAAFAWPLVGGPIAGLFAYFAHQKGDVVQRNLALAAVAVALIVVILISFFPGTWDDLLPWVNLQGPIPT
jgi:peptidoglycan/LPS O-acetylase OafA/YrhL